MECLKSTVQYSLWLILKEIKGFCDQQMWSWRKKKDWRLINHDMATCADRTRWYNPDLGTLHTEERWIEHHNPQRGICISNRGSWCHNPACICPTCPDIACQSMALKALLYYYRIGTVLSCWSFLSLNLISWSLNCPECVPVSTWFSVFVVLVFFPLKGWSPIST